MSRRRAAMAITLLALSLAATGCVERRMFITSEPSGARVRLNDQDVGITPLEVDFTFFGVYDVRVTKQGYEPLITSREAKAPLHEIPPFDLGALLIPGTKTTHIHWEFQLEPAHNDPDRLLQNAAEMRDRVQREAALAQERDSDDQSDETPATPPSPAPTTPTPADTQPEHTGADYQEVTPSGK